MHLVELFASCALLIFFAPFTAVRAAPLDSSSAASFFVPSLPDIHQDPNHPLTIFSGHLSSDPNEGKASNTDVTAHIFFVLVRNRRAGDRPRLMFWFNGGPGCSSFDGLMMEVGPWRMNPDGVSFSVADGGWEEYTTMVYVDQPAGTGFSYTSTNQYIHTLDEASTQFIEFLRNFYNVFPEYRNVDTYLGGESFAGQYIPYFAQSILGSNLKVPLRGAAIGNGWIDPRRQYPSYLDFAVKVGLLEPNTDPWKAAKERTDECMRAWDKLPAGNEPVRVDECEGLLSDVLKVKLRTENGKKTCLNIYDIRLEDEYPACGMNWPPPLHNITTYLGRADVVRALHADAHPGSWVECKGRVHQEIRENEIQSAINILPKLLERIPVLMFAGDQDVICNYMGLESMMQAMTWNGAKGLGTVQTQTWTVDGSPAGTWVSSRNLTYAKLFNASHMAGYDLPHVTHDMILRFMGFNFSAIVEGSAKIPSSIGGDTKPVFVGGDAAPTNTPPAKTPEQDKAMWEAYYNAGSAALVLVIIFLIIGAFVWYRMRRRGLKLPVNENSEEHIPLNASNIYNQSDMNDDRETESFRQRKGKERATGSQEAIFDVGESSDDEEEEDDGYVKSKTGY
ncbi:alpha/beta-hydrolase [Pluteus cervinus]|uniref:Alpha/beta-hydrolase n=1 Tax=Pluteus cervinus TaxID=181527 RepID=A0ACD3B322_9AGAR|nr:alpha/beta-hydrolase [Pluteus cervinus]